MEDEDEEDEDEEEDTSEAVFPALVEAFMVHGAPRAFHKEMKGSIVKNMRDLSFVEQVMLKLYPSYRQQWKRICEREHQRGQPSPTYLPTYPHLPGAYAMYAEQRDKDSSLTRKARKAIVANSLARPPKRFKGV